MYNLELQIRL